jgi:hypothetical protein
MSTDRDGDLVVARVEVTFRPFVSASLDRATGPRGTETAPYMRCILQTGTAATNVHLMVGPIELELVRYETDAVFLNAAFALANIRVGDRFRVPSTAAPMGHGRVLAWQDGFVEGARRLGDGRHLFAEGETP